MQWIGVAAFGRTQEKLAGKANDNSTPSFVAPSTPAPSFGSPTPSAPSFGSTPAPAPAFGSSKPTGPGAPSFPAL